MNVLNELKTINALLARRVTGASEREKNQKLDKIYRSLPNAGFSEKITNKDIVEFTLRDERVEILPATYKLKKYPVVFFWDRDRLPRQDTPFDLKVGFTDKEGKANGTFVVKLTYRNGKVELCQAWKGGVGRLLKAIRDEYFFFDARAGESHYIKQKKLQNLVEGFLNVVARNFNAWYGRQIDKYEALEKAIDGLPKTEVQEFFKKKRQIRKDGFYVYRLSEKELINDFMTDFNKVVSGIRHDKSKNPLKYQAMNLVPSEFHNILDRLSDRQLKELIPSLVKHRPMKIILDSKSTPQGRQTGSAFYVNVNPKDMMGEGKASVRHKGNVFAYRRWDEYSKAM